jgi:trk system potassium uptake protein TrkA
LSGEGHDTVLVDHKQDALLEAQSRMDILVIAGHGCSPSVLASAGLGDAQLVVAVTGDDEVNMIACSIARAAGVPYRVARIGREEYFRYPERIDLEAFGISRAIFPIRECAQEIVRLLTIPGTYEVVDLLGGKVLAAGIPVSTMSPLLKAPLKRGLRADLLSSVRFILKTGRGAEEIPHGETQFDIGDKVVVAAPAAAINPFLDEVFPDRPRIRKVVISGGTSLGLETARELETASEMEIVLLEADPVRAEACAAALQRTVIIHGDLLSADVVSEAGIHSDTAYFAATDDDEYNIISCLLASRQDACHTLARVARSEYLPVIERETLLDRPVNPSLSMMNAILRHVRGQSVFEATSMDTLPGEWLEVVLSDRNEWVGHAIRDLKMPKESILAAVQREDSVHVPTGDFTLEAGDRIVVFALPRAVSRLSALFSR